ncbi:MAG: hypothetical protein HQL13_04195 [Candidatus Omnitrophica bacterium]|nr:hypothetical protein [Candidatus Omnitrophota bacterium]
MTIKAKKKTSVRQTIKSGNNKEIKNVAQKAFIIKKSMAGIGRNMSESAERVAEIILDEHKDIQGHKSQKIKDETISMFKGACKQFKSDLKGVKLKDFIAVGAYSAGKASAAVSRAIGMILGR